MYSIGYKIVLEEVDRYRCRFTQLLKKIQVVKGSFDPELEFDAIVNAEDSESVFRFLTILMISYDCTSDSVKRSLENSLKESGLM